MKRLVVLSILIACTLNLIGKPVDPATAKRVGLKFLERTISLRQSQKPMDLKLVYTKSLQGSEMILYYIFNIEELNGFVIVSADDRALPILGYSNESTFDIEKIPPNAEAWLQNYAEEIHHVVSNMPTADIQTKNEWTVLLSENSTVASKNTSEIAPLLKTKWSQGKYYNEYCPVFPNGKSYTGCVATAMAQVMKYWNYPAQGKGANKYYSWGYGELSADFSSSRYEWGLMPDSLTDSSPWPAISSVASIIYHAGVAAHMNYGVDGSGARVTGPDRSALFALKNYFGYDTSLKGYHRETYKDSWEELLKSDLEKGQPILYAGYSSNAGHCWVIDGHSSNYFFHMNWGWGGAFDGYFILTRANPQRTPTQEHNAGYNFLQSAVTGIKPFVQANINAQSPMNYIMVHPNPATDYLYISSTLGSTLGMYLTDMNGRVVKKVPTDVGESILDMKDLPNGVYLLRVQNSSGSHSAHKITVCR